MAKVGIFNQPSGPNRKPLKPPVTNSPAGDYYGTGFKAKIGRMRGGSTGQVEVSPALMKKPPRSLA